MKKIFSLVAALCMVMAVSAEVVWTETLDKNGTYIDKNEFNGYWPYASQWWDAGNFVNEYTNVASYYCSVRGKKIDGAAENQIGFYYGHMHAYSECYLTLEGEIYTAKEGDKLMFEICSTEQGSADESLAEKTKILINDVELTIPTMDVVGVLQTITVEIPLTAGAITKMHISFDNLVSQKFITNLRIEDNNVPEGFENTTVSSKAVKTIDENGQLVIIKNGVKYNALGAVIE